MLESCDVLIYIIFLTLQPKFGSNRNMLSRMEKSLCESTAMVAEINKASNKYCI